MASKGAANWNQQLFHYCNSLESRIGYRFFLGFRRHCGFYENAKSWPIPINAALRRMEEKLLQALDLPRGSKIPDCGCAPIGPTPLTNMLVQYVPDYGEKGVLVVFGGESNSDGAIGPDDFSCLLMSNIHIIDIAALMDTTPGPGSVRIPKEQLWYVQNATDDVLQPRGESCAVLATAPDKSSHNIYIYAGRNQANNVYYDDVYVLSLPSFTWTKVYGPGDKRCYGHTCHAVGNGQMLTIGGDLPWGAGGESFFRVADMAGSWLTCTYRILRLGEQKCRHPRHVNRQLGQRL